ncbi:hypothetical protein ACNKHK_11495 [Shigella flexneri]
MLVNASAVGTPMPGKQHVVDEPTGDGTHHPESRHWIYLQKNESRSFFIHVVAREPITRFSAHNSGLQVNRSATTGVNNHHAVFHLLKGLHD